jgi:hypothetical protein
MLLRVRRNHKHNRDKQSRRLVRLLNVKHRLRSRKSRLTKGAIQI